LRCHPKPIPKRIHKHIPKPIAHQVINRSPSYRNRYVHRRDSVRLGGGGFVAFRGGCDRNDRCPSSASPTAKSPSGATSASSSTTTTTTTTKTWKTVAKTTVRRGRTGAMLFAATPLLVGGDLDDDLCREVDGDDGYGDDDEDLHQTAEAARAGHR
jgi:hypothetical protein